MIGLVLGWVLGFRDRVRIRVLGLGITLAYGLGLVFGSMVRYR